MYKVCKFGGSSVATPEKFKQVKKVVTSDKSRHVVVVSALGKADKSDNKITDLLYLIYQHRKYHVDATPLLKEVENRYLKIQDELGLQCHLEEEFDRLAERIEANSISEEELVSRGEYFSAKLMAGYLGFDFVDSKDLIRFDYDSKVNDAETNARIEKASLEHDYMVVPGFYGSYPNGSICLFSRGGSDVTGSYLAKGCHANLYENFTDVSGFYMCNPAFVPNPRRISYVSYNELRELSSMGANVIHQETVLPLADENIPILILNTFAPEEGGTYIERNTVNKTHHLITGITGKKNYSALVFMKKRNADKLTVLLQVLNLFAKYHVAVEHVPTSIDSFTVVFEKAKLEERYYDLVSELNRIEDIESIGEVNDIALIAVVGENMVKKPGTSGRILSVFGQEGINIVLIDQDVQEYSIIVGVSNKDFEHSIRTLYDHFAHEKVKD